MDFTRAPIAKLEGSSNYQVWSIKMKSYLIANDLWDVINIKSTEKLTRDMTAKNSKAMALIILSCEDHIIRILNPDELAATAWSKLEKQYGHVGFSARHLAFQSLTCTQLSSCQNIDQFIDQFRTHMRSLCQLTSAPLPQWLLLSILINNVGIQFESWSQSLLQQLRSNSIPEDSSAYLDEVIASLIDEARRISHATLMNEETALAANRNVFTKSICAHCGKTHKSENCWEKFPEKRPTRFTPSAPEFSVKNQYNHSTQNVAFLSKKKPAKNSSWILDSGATQHMCNDRSQFINFQPMSTSITIADSKKMKAIGKGNINVRTNKGKFITLKNVLYVPKLSQNLLSICCAMKNTNIRFDFQKRSCNIFYKNDHIAETNYQNSLLVLKTSKSNISCRNYYSSLNWQ